MSLALVKCGSMVTTPTDTSALLLLAGHESGHAIIHRLQREGLHYNSTPIYISQPHKQPVLSIAPCVPHHLFFTSAADPYLTSHPLPLHHSFPTSSTSRSTAPSPSPPLKAINTGHSGLQSLAIRSDSRILATAGWDSRARLYSAKTLKELAVLKWHKVGCYAVAFAEVLDGRPEAYNHTHEKSTPDALEQGTGQNDNQAVDRRRNTQTVSKTQQAREDKARNMHWIAVGSKDGNVSMWDVY